MIANPLHDVVSASCADEARVSVLPDDWTMHSDGADVWYFNSRTNQSQWERPEAAAPKATPVGRFLDMLRSIFSPGEVPNLSKMSWMMQYFVLFCLGTYNPSPSPLRLQHFIWLSIAVTGYYFLGPFRYRLARPDKDLDVVAPFFFAVAPIFLFLRFSVGRSLQELAPLITAFADPSINSENRMRRDRYRFNCIFICFVTLLPSTIIVFACYCAQVLYKSWWCAQPSTESESCVFSLSFSVAFACLILITFLLALQVIFMYTLRILLVFQLRLLRELLEKKDMCQIRAELSSDTPSAKRWLLASAPKNKKSAFYTGRTPREIDSSSTQDQDTTRPEDIPVSDMDEFLRLYRAVSEGAATLGSRWSFPLGVFIFVYAYLFVVVMLSQIKNIAKVGFDQSAPIDIGFLYVILAFLYVLFSFLPVITINSTWRRLINNADMSWHKWSAQDRIVLSAYFTEHPVVFPVLFLTITWERVLLLGATALAPLFIDIALSSIR